MYRNRVDKSAEYSVELPSILAIVVLVLTGLPNSSQAQQQTDLHVQGTIKPTCAFEQDIALAAQGSVDVFFDIDPENPAWSRQSQQVRLSLSCNTPFTIAARSSNGGLKNIASLTPSLSGNFSNQIAYQLAVNITTDDAASPMALTCQSREMASDETACNVSSGTNAAIGLGAGVGDVAVSLSGSSGFPVRGRYQDTIVLSLAFQ